MRSGGDWERPTPYKMWLDETQDIDIPEPMTSKASYSATLGHKVYIFLKTSGWFSANFVTNHGSVRYDVFSQVCHSFSPNSETDLFCHPRFGMIRCIATTKAVRAGQEITINYGCRIC